MKSHSGGENDGIRWGRFEKVYYYINNIYNHGIDDFKVCKGAQDAFLSYNLSDVQ